MLLGLLSLLLLAQIPFIYRRWQTAALNDRIAELAAQRVPSGQTDYKTAQGVIHVHTSLGGHSRAVFPELAAAAKANSLDFVVMTEHVDETLDTAALTLKGDQQGVLFINGNELSTADDSRFLLVPGGSKAFAYGKNETADFLAQRKMDGQLAFVTYPDRLKTPDADFDGVEVFSLHTNAKRKINRWLILDALWSFPSYPEATLARHLHRSDEELRFYDGLTASRKLTAFAGSDAHSNIGFHLFSDETGSSLLSVKLDPYETVFRVARTHVLLKKDEAATQGNILRALKGGNCYIGFDVLGDASGFTFTAQNGSETKIMGEEIAFSPALSLMAIAPLNSRFVLFRNGEKLQEFPGQTEMAFTPTQAGTYRVEVYLDALGSPFDQTPWIISNPIYVK